MSRPERKDETPFILNDGKASDAFGSKRLGAQEQVSEEQGGDEGWKHELPKIGEICEVKSSFTFGQ